MSNESTNITAVNERYYEYQKLKGDISRIEKDIEYAEMRIKRGEAYLRLEKNDDWKAIVEEGYFKDLANGAIKSLGKGRDGNVSKEDWMEILSSIGHLQTYLEGIVQFKSQAEIHLQPLKDELVYLKSQESATKL